MVFLEIGVVSLAFVLGLTFFFASDRWSSDYYLYSLPSFRIFALIAMATLTTSAAFRISTIIQTRERFFLQRLDFFGCCTRSYPPYTPTAVLLHRTLARPLVRGESKVIIFARALVVIGIAIVVPALGYYWTVITPTQAEIYIKSLQTLSWSDQLELFTSALKGNASIVVAA
ncbi:hypothetical protein B0H14DRAFT_1289340 [Mycena olivaceomarginata]|nr:hypothetical protein B0H14DRAFT_1289340 [Mycena olivaceomarginata]